MSFNASIDEIVAQNHNQLLGAAPSWPRVRLKEIANILNGFPFESRKFRKDRGIPLLRIRDVVRGTTETFYEGEFDPAFFVQSGDLVVGMDGDFHCARWRGEPALLNQRVCKISVNSSRYEPKFLEYILPGYLAAINARTPSVTVKHLSSRTVGDIPLPCPSRDEQKRVVAQIEKQFTRLDAGVKSLKCVQVALKRYRASVIKAACDGPWPRTTVGNVAAELRYGTSAKTSRNADGIPVLRMGNIFDGRLQDNDLKYLPEVHSEFPDLLLEPGDLLFNRTNSAELVGKTAVYDGNPHPCSFASYLIRVRLKDNYHPAFLSYYINSHYGRQWIANVVSQQVGQANVNGSKLKALEIPNPPLRKQRSLVSEVERRLSIIEELESILFSNLQRAASLRHSILRYAVSGKLVDSNTSGPKQFSPTAKRHFLRVLLSAEIVHRLHAEPTFGQTKHQKVFHLCEHVAQLEELDVEYHRDAAGPYDSRVIHSNAAELKRLSWYEEYPRDGIGRAYRPLAKAGKHQKYLTQYWPVKLQTISRIIELMRTWKTDRCEIFSTVYAAWNDLIIWNRAVTDDMIMHEILNCWHESKRSIEEKRWRAAIGWMREHGYAPTGFGKPTRKMS